MTELYKEVPINELVARFMKEYEDKVSETSLPEANIWVDSTLLPAYTTDMDFERSGSFVKTLSPLLQAFLLRESEPAEETIEELTEDATV